MNGIQVKCYLFPKGVKISAENVSQTSEIRRFTIGYNPSGLYNQLIEKIKTAYGNLIKPDAQIKTYWQDEENDLVCFSTDHEALYAVDLLTAVRLSTDSIGSSLFKVYVSIMDSSEKQESPKTEEPQLHPGISCDGCEGSVRGTRYTCTVCPDYDLCSTCKNKGIHNEHEFIIFDKPVRQRCPYGGRNRGFFRGLNRPRCSGQGHQQQPSTNSTPTNPLAGIFPFISAAIPSVNDPEQLKNFGEYLKQFLDPFGIDVDYHVDSKDKKQEEKNKQEETKKQETEKETEKSSPNSSFVNVDQKMETLIDLSSSKTSEELKASVENSDTTPSAPNKPVESASMESAVNSLKEAIEKQSFVEFPNLLSLKTEEKCEDVEDNGFNMVDIEKELKYLKCIEQLKAMGYDDESGWLTRLVITKQGSINLVLDALQPSK